MLIPLRTNRPAKRRPVVTEALIVVNMLVFLIGLAMGLAGDGQGTERLIDAGRLARGDFHAWQLITYQFLHDPGGIWHLAFNMLFLWVFGCAVEDRLGRGNFLAFYLIGGCVAGAAHMMVSPSPVIGASGSIAGVTGAFLALFPRSQIQILFVFFLIGIYHIPALWFIGFYFVVDVLRQAGDLLGRGAAGVAFMAHIAGYVYGFALGFLLLALGIVKREEFDVFFLLKQWRRRAEFRAASRDRVGGPWESSSADTGRDLAKRSAPQKKSGTGAEAPTAPVDPTAEPRARIREAIGRHDLAAAAARYRDLLRAAPEATLSEDDQLDLANQLQAEHDYEHAARAYELLLRAFPSCPKSSEVRLILAAIYARQLARPDRARELLEIARARLSDATQLALADRLLAELGT